jgi:hypothetical protein
MRKSLSLALLLSLSLVPAVLAAPQPTPSAFLQSLAAPTACSSTLPAPIANLWSPAPLERTGGCLQADCYSDQDCPCGNGYGVCGINNSCYYPPSGSGGGGGLGCPQADCYDDAQCRANCASGYHSFCNLGGTCVYVP